MTVASFARAASFAAVVAFAALGARPSAAQTPLTPDWTWQSDLVGAKAGVSVANAGDVNGDGWSDVIVGAAEYSNGQSDEGAAWLFLGGPTGPATTWAWRVESDSANAMFGAAVSSAGDVNGDGYSDVMVGAPHLTNGQNEEGAAFVFLGNPGGLATIAAWTQEGGVAFAHYGAAVASAGDGNGDGFSDVVVGAPDLGDGQVGEGVAFVYHGAAAGLATTAATMIEIDVAFANLGAAVAGVGDANGDGIADLVVGAPGYTNGQVSEGGAFCCFGGLNGFPPTPSWSVESDVAGALLGASIAAAGDVNGDGRSDVIVGSPNLTNGFSNEGRASLYLGSAASIATTAAWSRDGGATNALFGSSVACAGDANADGYADVAVGAPGADSAAIYRGGPVSPDLNPFRTIAAPPNATVFPESLAFAGDVDGDGLGDLIAGTTSFSDGETDEGAAFAFLGFVEPPQAIPSVELDEPQAAASFGAAVASSCDVNGDGFADVVVGTSSFDAPLADAGRVSIFAGAAGGPSTTATTTRAGTQADAELGVAVADAGDVDGDGFSDVVAGAWLWSNFETNEGAAFLWSGGVGGISASPAWSVESGKDVAVFGLSVAGAGDVNADGFSDVIVGAPLYGNGESQEGAAFVYLGGPTGLATSAAWHVEGQTIGAQLGKSVACAGDVDADGYSDVVVGGPNFQNVVAEAGRVFVHLGGPAGPGVIAAWTASGSQPLGHLGWSVAGACDVNGDGASDVLVGEPGFTATLAGEGRALVYLGAVGAPPATTPSWTAVGGSVGASFGFAVAGAGDANGDGLADVVVGAAHYTNGEANEGAAFLYRGARDATGLETLPAWRSESDQADGFLGAAVAGAGDVNADGVADLVLGALRYDSGSADSGAVFVHLANSGRGFAIRPRQSRSDGSRPIVRDGRAPDDGLTTTLLARTTSGRSRVKLESEVTRALPFQSRHVVGFTPAWTDTGLPGVDLPIVTSGLVDASYRWRVRVHEHPTTIPYQPAGPWITAPWNGGSEADLRVKAIGPILALDDASPIVLTAKFGDGSTQVVRDVSNVGGLPLSWIATTTPAAPWVMITPASGAGLRPIDGATAVSISLDPGTLAPGLHSTTIRFANAGDAANFVDVPVTLNVTGVHFEPGDKLRANLVGPDDITAAAFDAVEGMSLKLAFTPATGATKLVKTLVSVLEPDGTVRDAFLIQIAPGATVKKKVKVKKSGTHTLSFESIDAGGAFSLRATRVLPAAAKAFTQVKDPAVGQLTVTFESLLLPNATLDARFTPKTFFNGPMTLAVEKPNGAAYDVSGFQQPFGAGGLELVDVPITLAGRYTITIGGFGSSLQKVRGRITPNQPPTGTSTIVLP